MRKRGYTLIEMVVVLIIIGILSATAIAAFIKMQKGQRLNMAHDKVLSTLFLARNLAIGNDAVYHIRLESFNNTQYISIYCFPKVTDALSAQPELNARDAWSANFSLTSPYNNFRVEYIALDSGTYAGYQTVGCGGTLSQQQGVPTPTATSFASEGLIAPAGYYNGQILRMTSGLDAGQKVVISNVDSTSYPPVVTLSSALTNIPLPGDSFVVTPPVLFFYPDGSASRPVTIYVSDDPTWNDIRSDPLSRQKGFNHGGNMRMVKVLQGGMIKAANRI